MDESATTQSRGGPLLAGAGVGDPAILARARSADPDALGDLFQEYAERMLGVARGIVGSADEAQDVVQDVFVGLPEALRGFDGSGPLAAWLRRLTARAALLRLRSEKRRMQWHRRAAAESSRQHRPGAVEARITLERVVSRMPGELRAVYLLKEIEGHSHGEIAELLGISPGASEVRLHRARKFLKDRLRGRL
jgi:RNA polymerase sigma-70 factor, ECF subfamily